MKVFMANDGFGKYLQPKGKDYRAEEQWCTSIQIYFLKYLYKKAQAKPTITYIIKRTSLLFHVSLFPNIMKIEIFISDDILFSAGWAPGCSDRYNF